MKFVTFNIRCDFGQDGANNFIYRRPLILEKIRQEKPDIIGFQEVLPHVAAWLKENLTEYYIVGCGREKDLTGEAMIIAYRKERFQSVSLEPSGCHRHRTCRDPAIRYRVCAAYCDGCGI